MAESAAVKRAGTRRAGEENHTRWLSSATSPVHAGARSRDSGTGVPGPRIATRCTGIAVAMLALGVAGSAIGQAAPQIAPRLTGELIVTQLDAAQHDLAQRAAESPGSSLAETSRKLASLS